jgi:hypothetical protein
MISKHVPVLLAAGSLFALAACNKPTVTNANAPAATTETKAPSDPVESAMAAAPEVIGADATIVAANPDGSMKTLREGKNGWTCMPDNPQTPGHDPMCMDGNAMKWAAAWIAHKPPPPNNVGLMYMLQGGSDASNTDPWGTKPSDGKWVETGPHVMVVGAPSLNAQYPSSATPDTSKPYVMFGGTPYAHLMIPIK